MLLLYIVTMVIGVTTATSSYSGYYFKVFDVVKLCMIIVVMTINRSSSEDKKKCHIS